MKIKVQDLQAGNVIQKDIMGKTNYPIISANTELTDQHIQFLHAFLIKEVDIHPRNADGEIHLPPVSEETDESDLKVKAAITATTSFSDAYKKAVELYKKEFQSWQLGVKVNIANIRSILLPLFEQAEAEKDWIQDIHIYSDEDDYIYHHAIGTSLLTNALAEELNYDKGKRLQVAFSACLADCGMAKIPSTIIHKTTPLSTLDWETIRKHPIFSYQLVKDITLLKPETKLAIFQHHERLDGSGYPKGEKGDRIHPQSQIVALADIYHAMTSKRRYKERVSPYKVIQIMEEDHFGQFDIGILKTLTSLVVNISTGTLVQLSDGRMTEIIFLKPDALTRPLIKTSDSGEVIDLERNRHLYIQKVLK